MVYAPLPLYLGEPAFSEQVIGVATDPCLGDVDVIGECEEDAREEVREEQRFEENVKELEEDVRVEPPLQHRDLVIFGEELLDPLQLQHDEEIEYLRESITVYHTQYHRYRAHHVQPEPKSEVPLPNLLSVHHALPFVVITEVRRHQHRQEVREDRQAQEVLPEKE